MKLRLRTRIGVIVALVSAATCVAFILIINVVINNYISTEAKAALQYQISQISTDIDAENPAPPASSIMFEIGVFSVKPDYSFLRYDGDTTPVERAYSVNDRQVQRYLANARIDFSKPSVFSADISGQKYYIGVMTWDADTGAVYAPGQPVDELPIEGQGVLFDPPTDELAPAESQERMVFHINTSSFDGVISLANWLFALTLVVSVLAAVFGGVRAGRALEESQHKLKVFFTNASHELKTPLMSIAGYAEGLKNGVIKDVPKGAGVILEQSNRMGSLIDEILLISKIDSGFAKFERQPVDLNEVADSCVSPLQAVAAQKDIHIDTVFASEPAEVIGDAVYLRKVIDNILSNSVRYACAHILVEVGNSAGQVCVRISDDGPGVAEADLRRVFERFYKGNDGITGIGLSVANEITTLHKGKLTVENGHGSMPGACFTMVFPRATGA